METRRSSAAAAPSSFRGANPSSFCGTNPSSFRGVTRASPRRRPRAASRLSPSDGIGFPVTGDMRQVMEAMHAPVYFTGGREDEHARLDPVLHGSGVHQVRHAHDLSMVSVGSDVGVHEVFDDMPHWDRDADEMLTSGVIWGEQIGHNVSTCGGLLDLLASGEGHKVCEDDELEQQPMAKSDAESSLAVELGMDFEDSEVIWDEELTQELHTLEHVEEATFGESLSEQAAYKVFDVVPIQASVVWDFAVQKGLTKGQYSAGHLDVTPNNMPATRQDDSLPLQFSATLDNGIWDDESVHGQELNGGSVALDEMSREDIIWDGDLSSDLGMHHELLQQSVCLVDEEDIKPVISDMLTEENYYPFVVAASINVAESGFMRRALEEANAAAHAEPALFRNLMERKHEASELFSDMPSEIVWDDIPSGGQTHGNVLQLVMGVEDLQQSAMWDDDMPQKLDLRNSHLEQCPSVKQEHADELCSRGCKCFSTFNSANQVMVQVANNSGGTIAVEEESIAIKMDVVLWPGNLADSILISEELNGTSFGEINELQSEIDPSVRKQWDPGISTATAWGQAVFRGGGNVPTQIWPNRSPSISSPMTEVTAQPKNQSKSASPIKGSGQQGEDHRTEFKKKETEEREVRLPPPIPEILSPLILLLICSRSRVISLVKPRAVTCLMAAAVQWLANAPP